MIEWRLVATSSAVSLSPLWNLTSSRILKVQVLPPSVGSDIPVQTSQTKSVVDDGLFGLIRIRTL